PNNTIIHGIPSMSHKLFGELLVDGHVYNFDGGRGYLQSTWGQHFPSDMVWLQSNHFNAHGTAISAAVVVVRLPIGSIRMMYCGLLHGGTLYSFASHTGARLERFNITDHAVYITYRDRNHRLELMTERRPMVDLPLIEGTDEKLKIPYTAQAITHIELTARVGNSVQTILRGKGQHTALTVHGSIERLMR
ncbi:MAG: tocopherol cyclase family protein, partial [Chloroflexota bacterium]